MKNTTLCYIENEKGEYLMLHRVKKQNDLNLSLIHISEPTSPY